jgi:hypothetical protein
VSRRLTFAALPAVFFLPASIIEATDSGVGVAAALVWGAVVYLSAVGVASALRGLIHRESEESPPQPGLLALSGVLGVAAVLIVPSGTATSALLCAAGGLLSGTIFWSPKLRID